jgi:flagella basal body P-ring formation protein FlgA
MRISFIIACFGCLVAASDAGEIVLRSKTAVRGSIVRLSDLAEVKGSEGEQAELLAAMPLMPAPAAGSTRFLRAAEVRDLLVARSVDLNGWRIVGADAVEFSLAKAAAVAQTNEQEMPAANLSGADQLTLLIKNYLQQKAAHELWSVTADADDDVLALVEDGGASVKVSGGKAPWAGRQRFLLSTGSAKPVAVYARVERMVMAAFAVRSIERGELVRRSDVELRPFGGSLPSTAVTSPEAVIGKEAAQRVPEGTLVLGSYVRSPIVVRRGERVSVRARAAGIVVSTFAIAQQDGGVGDLVTVEVIDRKERYAARVSGVRELEVFAAEPRATEMAAAPAALAK